MQSYAESNDGVDVKKKKKGRGGASPIVWVQYAKSRVSLRDMAT